MRTYLAQELIGGLWFASAVIARSENLDRIWIACMAIAFFYFLRAILNWGIAMSSAKHARIRS